MIRVSDLPEAYDAFDPANFDLVRWTQLYGHRPAYLADVIAILVGVSGHGPAPVSVELGRRIRDAERRLTRPGDADHHWSSMVGSDVHPHLQPGESVDAPHSLTAAH